MEVKIADKKTAKIFRKTESTCPVCMAQITAAIVEKDGAVYLQKSCAAHGDFSLLISRNAQDYKELSNYYFYFIPQEMPQQEYYVCATSQCNIGCPICFLTQCAESVSELSLTGISKLAQDKDIKRLTFSHGEPTLSPNLFEVIKGLGRLKKIVNMHTNGLKLSSFTYVQQLKASGIDHVSMQFDGFSQAAYQLLRGRSILESKLKALDNLKRLSVPVTLNVTIAKGINEEQVGQVFDYALSQNFIKDISFITYCQYDPDKEVISRYIMPEELLENIEHHSRGKISQRNIKLFQKLFYAYVSAFQKRKCFYYYHFLVVRRFKSYLPIDEFIDLSRACRYIEKAKLKNKRLGRMSFLVMLLASLKWKSIYLIFHGISILFRGGYPKKPSKFLTITFATICDPYKYDAAISRNCGQGIIFKDNLFDSYSTFLMEQMRKKRK